MDLQRLQQTSSKSRPKLKTELKRRELRLSGNKQEMAERLVDDDAEKI
jgi:hypothetical protein